MTRGKLLAASWSERWPEDWQSRVTFITHLSYVRDKDWQAIDLARFLHNLTLRESSSERAALITLDELINQALR